MSLRHVTLSYAGLWSLCRECCALTGMLCDGQSTETPVVLNLQFAYRTWEAQNSCISLQKRAGKGMFSRLFVFDLLSAPKLFDRSDHTFKDETKRMPYSAVNTLPLGYKSQSV